MAPWHWSDGQDEIHESVSPELLESWPVSRDEWERIERAEQYRDELAEVEADAERLAADFAEVC